MQIRYHLAAWSLRDLGNSGQPACVDVGRLQCSMVEQGDNHLVIIGKGVEVTKPIREYIESKVEKIEKLTPQIIDVKVRIEVQKIHHLVDIVLKFSHFAVKVGAATDEMYAAIDKAFSRLDRKLRRWKDRIQDHHAKGVAVTEMEINVLEGASIDQEELDREIVDANNQTLEGQQSLPKVIKKKKRSLKVLTLEEAVMKMELSSDHFLVYRSEEDRTLKILYRRRDGSYGVISPE